MTFWAALGRAPGGFRAVLVEGTRVAAEATATSEAAALAALGAEPARVLRIGEGAPARLPAKVLPESGHGLPGFTQAQPADAIGGWVRLSLAGFLAQQGDWDGIVCALEGDVSHWVHLSAGEAVSSQSFLTPRLVAALGGAERPSEAALQDSLSRPERLAAHLRSAEVAGDAEAITGHLMGAELAAARAYWLGQQVAVIGPAQGAHATALALQGVPSTAHAPEDLIAPGLAALARALGLAG